MARRKRRWRRIVLTPLAVVLLAPLALTALYRVVPPPLTPLMVIRLAEGEGLRRSWLPLREIAPALPRSVVAAEDNLFCRHWGYDLQALESQVEKAEAGGRPRGASTISNQLAKNLFLWPDRSLVRKALEMWLTAYVELVLPKRRILELYLNEVEWGRGIYGAEAAAETDFGVSAADLSDEQAALMAAVLPNPREMSAARPSAYVRERAAVYRHRIAQLGPELLGCW
jgi:monofunctional biosynthetic peptidoglycan transglycosylase